MIALIRDFLIGIGLETVRLIAGLILFFFWLPWHKWRTWRERRTPRQEGGPDA